MSENWSEWCPQLELSWTIHIIQYFQAIQALTQTQAAVRMRLKIVHVGSVGLFTTKCVGLTSIS